MFYADVSLSAGVKLWIPTEHEERAIFIVDGSAEFQLNGGTFNASQLVVFKPGAEIVLTAPLKSDRLILLGGEPLGTPFTIFNSNIDADQNGILFDPLPAGSFTSSRTFANGETFNFAVDNKGGVNGARLPGFFSVDLRLAYKFSFTERINAGFTFEVFNLANRTNYDELTVSGNTSQSTFLIPSVAKPPRTLQLGFRIAF